MIPSTTRSYPYLAIAQRYGVPYGCVLTIADNLDKQEALGINLLVTEPVTPWFIDVVNVWHWEQTRRTRENVIG